jgi:hypothetical protein
VVVIRKQQMEVFELVADSGRRKGLRLKVNRDSDGKANGFA